MADNPSKLQNIQLPAHPSDGFPSGIVEPDCLTGGEIDGGSVPSAAEKSVERRPCDCEYSPCRIAYRRQMLLAAIPPTVYRALEERFVQYILTGVPIEFSDSEIDTLLQEHHAQPEQPTPEPEASSGTSEIPSPRADEP